MPTGASFGARDDDEHHSKALVIICNLRKHSNSNELLQPKPAQGAGFNLVCGRALHAG